MASSCFFSATSPRYFLMAVRICPRRSGSGASAFRLPHSRFNMIRDSPQIPPVTQEWRSYSARRPCQTIEGAGAGSWGAEARGHLGMEGLAMGPLHPVMPGAETCCLGSIPPFLSVRLLRG